MRRASHQSSLIDTVRESYRTFSSSVDTVESIFLAFKTIVQRTKLSPEPKTNIFLDFMDSDVGFGLYWNNDVNCNDTINIAIWQGNGNNVESIIDETIEINCNSYFLPLFECAKYLQTNRPTILKSMSLENILYHIISEADEDEVQVHYSSHFAFPKSRYVPLSI